MRQPSQMHTVLTRPWARPAGLAGRLAGWEMAHGKEPLNELVTELLGAGDGDTILEVGFGPGVTLAHLARAVPGAHLIGVDPSPVMLCQATQRNRAAMIAGRVELRLGVAEELTLPDGAVSRAVVIHSLHHWNDPERGLAEVRRALSPRGRLVLALRGAHDEGAARARAALLAAGFCDVRSAARSPGVSSTVLVADTDDRRT
jgi:ubiquinone/menaquinone biosynthesis C-methylase UbiE